MSSTGLPQKPATLSDSRILAATSDGWLLVAGTSDSDFGHIWSHVAKSPLLGADVAPLEDADAGSE